MDERSMLDIAYELISKTKEGIKFNDVFDQVCSLKEKTEEEKVALIGRFYSDLLLDGRFLVLDDNVWDLRERYTFEKSHTEMDLESVAGESEESAEDKEDNQEYDAAMEGKTLEDVKGSVAEGDKVDTADSTNPQ